MKVSIIGTGMVGATFAYRLMVSGMATEIVLSDINMVRAEAEVEELNHCLATEHNMKIYAGKLEDTKDSDFLVVCAGVGQKPGQTRLDLAKTNIEIVRGILKTICPLSPNAILLMASNPLDVMTYLAVKESGFDPKKVIGSGTVLDSARFRYYLGEKLQANPKDIFAYVIGEHGDSQIEVFSTISIKGLSLKTYCKEMGIDFSDAVKQDIREKTSKAAYRIIQAKGATYYGIASALNRIIRAISRNENAILPVSSLLQGEYGLRDLCLAVPTMIGQNGVKKIMELDLNEEERQALQRSAEVVKSFDVF